MEIATIRFYFGLATMKNSSYRLLTVVMAFGLAGSATLLSGCSNDDSTAPLMNSQMSQALGADHFTQCLKQKQAEDAISGKDKGLMASDHVSECKDDSLSTKSLEDEAMKSR